MGEVVVPCPVCKMLNSVDTRRMYDGGEHFFECYYCGEPLFDWIEG